VKGGAVFGRFRFPLFQRDGLAPIAFEATAWEFWPGLLKRQPNGGWLWGGDAREISAANDPHFFGPTEAA